MDQCLETTPQKAHTTTSANGITLHGSELPLISDVYLNLKYNFCEKNPFPKIEMVDSRAL